MRTLSTIYTQEKKMNPTEIAEYFYKALDAIVEVHPPHPDLLPLLQSQVEDMQTDYEESLCQHPTKSMSKLNLSGIR